MLASVQKITSLTPIPNADSIETAGVLGWEVVVNKGEFQVGQLVCYIQIDTIVPDASAFEFLRDRKFRVRTIKLRGQISQGLIIPLTEYFNEKLRASSLTEGKDLTDIVGVKKYSKDESGMSGTSGTSVGGRVKRKNKQPWYAKYLYKYIPKLAKWLYGVHISGPFPSDLISKTDEERIQNVVGKVFNAYADKIFVGTEKLDGSSTTLIYTRARSSNRDVYRVCSRNLELFEEGNSAWWRAFKNSNWPQKLKEIADYYKVNSVIVQGELIGPSAQGNLYKLPTDQIYMFNLVLDGVRCDPYQMNGVAQYFSLNVVPQVFNGYLSEIGDMNAIVAYADGPTLVGTTKTGREGVVFRAVTDNFSFKAVSNKFLIKHNE